MTFPTQLRDGKMSPAGNEGVMVGYDMSRKAYRIFQISTGKVVSSNQVIFDENVFPLAEIKDTPVKTYFSTSSVSEVLTSSYPPTSDSSLSESPMTPIHDTSSTTQLSNESTSSEFSSNDEFSTSSTSLLPNNDNDPSFSLDTSPSIESHDVNLTSTDSIGSNFTPPSSPTASADPATNNHLSSSSEVLSESTSSHNDMSALSHTHNSDTSSSLHMDDIIAHLTKEIYRRNKTIEWLKTAAPTTKQGSHRLYEDIREQSLKDAGATKIVKKRCAQFNVFSNSLSLPTKVSTSHDQDIDKILDSDTNCIIPIDSFQANNIRTAVEHSAWSDVGSAVGQQSLLVPSFTLASLQMRLIIFGGLFYYICRL